jgi:hypothetical protein
MKSIDVVKLSSVLSLFVCFSPACCCPGSKVKAAKDRSSDFRLAYFTVDDLEVYSVRGDGLASSGALLVTYGGQTIEQNGLTIQSGGLTVADDPTTMNSDNPHRRVLTVTADSQLFDQDVVRISAKRTTSRYVG